MYNAIITKIKNVRPHPNADKVQLGTCHGNQVVIGIDIVEDQFGIYFMSDGQLSKEFCKANNLYRDALKNADPDAKPGMFDDNGRVRAQKFRGEKSDGFWIQLNSLSFVEKNIVTVNGFEFTEWKGVPICSKYINPETIKAARENQGKKTKTAKKSIMFKEHFDTGQFGRNEHEFEQGQLWIITEKVHGTSARIGNVLIDRTLSWLETLAKRFGVKVQENEWQYLNGTRHVVIEESTGKQYHDPTIRDKAFNIFNGSLRKGETVFCEIVGFEPDGDPIMPAVDPTKLNDKAFTKRYGKTMTYSYGCKPTECDIYVYRMTHTNEDGFSVDYSWDDVVKRCTEIGAKHVPVIAKLTMNELDLTVKMKNNAKSFVLNERDAKEELSRLVEMYASGDSILDPTHIKEGVCIRIEGGLNNKTFKFKSFEFRVLEGIVKDAGIIDAEEAQDTV